MSDPEVATAEARVMRLMGRIIAAGSVLYLLTLGHSILIQASIMAPWWTITAAIAVFVPPLLLGAVSFYGRIDVLRWTAVLCVCLFITATLTWPLAWSGAQEDSSTWISTLPGLAALAAVLIRLPLLTPTVLVVTVASTQFINCAWRDLDFGSAIVSMVYMFSVTATYVAAASRSIWTGRQLDRTREQSLVSVAAAADSRSRAQTRTRIHRFTHDWVMTTLLAVSSHDDREALRRYAGLTLQKMDALNHDDDADYEAVALASYLQKSISEIEEDLVIEKSITEAGETRFPADAVHTVGAATVEAVRNSVRHAGRQAHRTVRLSADKNGFEVAITDDGVGFEPEAVASDRLGLRNSIVFPVSHFPGGMAAVDAKPSEGTRVVLAWRVPNLPAQEANTVTARTLIGLNTPGAWIIALLYLASTFAMALHGSPTAHPGVKTLAALAITVAATLTLLLVRSDPMPKVATFALMIAIPLACWLWVSDYPQGSQSWVSGAVAVMATFLCLRGRVIASWISACASVAVCAIWSEAMGYGLLYGILITSAQWGLIAMATIFTEMIRPAMAEIISLRMESLRSWAAQAAASAALEESREQLVAVDRLVRPLLDTIAGPDALDENLATACRLAERQLRDRIRAPSLAVDAVATAAREARRRGIEVSLLDDGGLGGVAPDVRERLLNLVEAELGTTTANAISVRILPPGREFVATIFSRGADESRHLRMDHSGTVNGHWDIRADGLGGAGWADSRSPGRW